MSQEKGYQGWTNYETWATKLWMDNEESSYRYWSAAAQDAWDEAEADGVRTREDDATYTLADRLKEEHEAALPELIGFASDLLSRAIERVAWDEIARSLLGEVNKTEPAEEEVEESANEQE